MESLNIITFIGTLLIGGVILVVQLKNGATKATDDSNDILRKLLSDQEKLIEDQKKRSEAQDEEILKLRSRQHEQGNELQSLKLQFETLKQERKYLAQLVTLALADHFAANPEAAKAAQAIVAGEPLSSASK